MIIARTLLGAGLECFVIISRAVGTHETYSFCPYGTRENRGDHKLRDQILTGAISAQF